MKKININPFIFALLDQVIKTTSDHKFSHYEGASDAKGSEHGSNTNKA